MKRVFLPFDLPVYTLLNSNHPLVGCLVNEKYDGIEFVRAHPNNPQPCTMQQVMDYSTALAPILKAACPPEIYTDQSLIDFLDTRHPVSQMWTDTSCDVAFYHTAPVTLNQMPYFLHFESPTTLFFPYLKHGQTKDLILKGVPAYWYIRALLEQPMCRGIFTNLEISKKQIDRIFASDIISAKTRYVPPGSNFTDAEEQKVLANMASRSTKKRTEILFTNSWHQDPASFLLRGGHELVLAFLAIEKDYPDLHLTLRTAWVEQLNTIPIFSSVQNHPKITILPNMLTDTEIMDLYINADIFGLNSTGMHSLSILRAMMCGSVCLVSDIPGYDQYIKHGETGITITGQMAAIYTEEPETGMFRDCYDKAYDVNWDTVHKLSDTLRVLCDNPTLRHAVGANARRYAETHFPYAGWKNGFESILRDALDEEPHAQKKA